MATTTLDVGEVTSSKFKWVIKNFCTGCKKVGDKLVSPKFSTGACEWRLWLYPKGNTEDSKDYLSIFLRCLNETENETTSQFAFLNNKNNAVFERKTDKRIYNKEYSAWGYHQFVKRSLILNEANGLLVNDTLTILCEINTDENISVSSQNNETEIRVPECPLRLKEFDDYEKLLDSEKFSDVTFVVDDKRLHVHKIILANKSEVFAAMFAHSMKENDKNIVEMNDITYEVLKELLRFIYAGKVNGIEEKLAVDLLIAAEKYALEGLKVICQKYLCEKLSCSNALKYLNVADMHNATVLKDQSINFIVTHADDIVGKPELKLLDELHYRVHRELLCALMNKNKK